MTISMRATRRKRERGRGMEPQTLWSEGSSMPLSVAMRAVCVLSNKPASLAFYSKAFGIAPAYRVQYCCDFTYSQGWANTGSCHHCWQHCVAGLHFPPDSTKRKATVVHLLIVEFRV